MSLRRLLALLALAATGVLAITVPAVYARSDGRQPVLNTNGVSSGSIKDSPGSAANGKKIFVVFCGKCHVMKAANTTGTIGPNLDRDPVNYTNVVNAVIQGVGGVQAEYLLRILTFPQIYDVAKYVVTARSN